MSIEPIPPGGPRPAADAGAAGPALDAAALARLRELDPDGRHGVLGRVLGAFETSLQRMLGQLAAQRGTLDASVVASVAHTLKSSSSSVGALALARACTEVEQRVRSGTPGDLAAEIERLVAEGEAALAAVGAMLRLATPDAR